jgi:hypothetical protein
MRACIRALLPTTPHVLQQIAAPGVLRLPAVRGLLLQHHRRTRGGTLARRYPHKRAVSLTRLVALDSHLTVLQRRSADNGQASPEPAGRLPGILRPVVAGGAH